MRYRSRRRWESAFHALDIIRRISIGVVFWVFVILVVVALLSGRPPRTKKNSVLVVRPYGTLVDAYTDPLRYQGVPVGAYPAETLLDDLVSAIDHAGVDEKITGLWVDLQEMSSAGASAAGELGDAVRRFSNTGKPVVASADSFDTTRYRIASAANHIIVDRLGEVFPTGYGYWRAYLAGGLDKIGGEVNLFRSGESKSAGENLLLDQMSDAARRNEERLLGDLWEEWIARVAGNRKMETGDLNEWIENYDSYLLSAAGNSAASARNASLVDDIEIGGVVQNTLDRKFGAESRRINALDYIVRADNGRFRDPAIAVVPVVGSLVYGEGFAGSAGSSDIVASIEGARSTPGVRAIVLRIDSPGGDVRAGEEIRRSLEETRQGWDIPIVASLSNLAASGGYWIALESDFIVSRPETVTGSIGVYTISLSFKRGLEEWLGIRIDGLGTTPWSAMGHPGREMDGRTASLYEAGVADIDRMFKDLVMEKRGLDTRAVDELAGGIPWSGIRALELGLVDELGGLAEARNAAAEIAGLDDWKVLYFEKLPDPREAFLGRILWGRTASADRRYGRPTTADHVRLQTNNLLRLRRSSSP